MKIEERRESGIVGIDMFDINTKEMRQMHELKNRINDVLNSHNPDSKEKKYISDDDLKIMRTILSVFTRRIYSRVFFSTFDDELKAIDEEEKNADKTPELPQDSFEE